MAWQIIREGNQYYANIDWIIGEYAKWAVVDSAKLSEEDKTGAVYMVKSLTEAKALWIKEDQEREAKKCQRSQPSSSNLSTPRDPGENGQEPKSRKWWTIIRTALG